MTLQNDFAVLTGDKERAKLIVEDLLAEGRIRSDAYRKIVSEARAVQLDVVRISVLILKYENERRSALGMAERTDSKSSTGWDVQVHFDALAYCGVQDLVRARVDLVMLGVEILELGLQRLPIDSDAIEYIVEQHRAIESQLGNVDSAMSDKYLRMKNRWLRQHIELRGVERNRSDAVNRADSTRQAFMAVFGAYFLEERAQLNRMNIAHRRLEIIRENPAAGDVLFGHSQVLHQNHDGLKLGCPDLDIRDTHFTHRDDRSDSAADGFRQAKSLLRRVAALTHPDKVQQADLTTKQRRKLAIIWYETSSLRAQRANKSVLISSAPSLERKLNLAKRIMELSPIRDLDAEMVVPGRTIEDQFRWLATETRFLVERIDFLRAESGDLSTNRQLGYMRSLVDASEEVQAAARQAMVEKCHAYKRRARVLEREASRVLALAA